MSNQYDAIIIGAGVIGAAIALALAKSGRRTLNVDRLGAAGYGPTSGSCAIVRVHYSTRDGTALAWEGYHDWHNWTETVSGIDSPLAVFRETGCLVMATRQNGYLKRHTDICESLNIPFERWDKTRIQQRLPAYDLRCFWPPKRLDDPGFGEPGEGSIEQAVFFPTAGYVNDPQLATRNLQQAAERAGSRFLFNAEVVKVDHSGRKVSGVQLADGQRLSAPVVVNAAGPFAEQVNRMAGVLDDMTITTRALRQEVAHVPAPDGFDFEQDGLVISDGDIGCYCRPEQGNHILIGSEDPACDPREYVDPADWDRNFSEQWNHQALRLAQRIPSLKIPRQVKGVVELYDFTDDWIPIYDRSSLDGFYMAVGTSGNQFKNAPVVGRMMTELINYCERGGDHDTNPFQFALAHTADSVDAGFYSRRRPINSDSSFSVLG